MPDEVDGQNDSQATDEPMPIPAVLRLACLSLMTLAIASQATPVERLFVSGHSLTEPPMPAYLATIAGSLGAPLQWNMQSIPGSPIRTRTEGAGAEHAYRHGANREGRNLDVLAEWRAPRTVSGGPYDALLVAEQHGVLTALSFHDTPDALAGIHRHFTEANPQGRVWFYESWLSVDDKDDPSRWIAYERAASPVWQCVALRASRVLESMGKPSAIEPVPSGAALAALVERATTQQVAGISAATRRETMNRLFTDDVHLTPLGHYYMAAVAYATMWQRSPVGAEVPSSLEATAARTLQQQAWTFVSEWRAKHRAPSFAACRDHLRQSFIGQHWSYVRDTNWRREDGALQAYVRWARQMLAWHVRVRRSNEGNPFRDG
jgi:hypothetical protein